MKEESLPAEKLIPVGVDEIEYDELQNNLPFVLDGNPNQTSPLWEEIKRKIEDDPKNQDQDVLLFKSLRNYNGINIFSSNLEKDVESYSPTFQLGFEIHSFKIIDCCVEQDYCSLERGPRVYSPQNHYMLGLILENQSYFIPEKGPELELAMLFRSIILTGEYGSCPGNTNDVLIPLPDYDHFFHPLFSNDELIFKKKFLSCFIKKERMKKTGIGFNEEVFPMLNEIECLEEVQFEQGLKILTYEDLNHILENIFNPENQEYKFQIIGNFDHIQIFENERKLGKCLLSIKNSYWLYNKMTENPFIELEQDPSLKSFSKIFFKSIKKGSDAYEALIVKKINNED